MSSTDAANLSVGGGLAIGTNGFVKNIGTLTITVVNNFALGDSGYLYNGSSSSDAASLKIGGSFSIGAGNGFVFNEGTSAISVGSNFTLGSGGFVYNGLYSTDKASLTVGGNLTLGVSGGNGTFVYNIAESILHVAGNFTLDGSNSFVDNGESSSDTPTFTVGGILALDANSDLYNYNTLTLGGLSMGAGSYFVDYGTMSVSGAFDPGSASTASNDIVAGTFSAGPGSSVTTDTATWDVLAGADMTIGSGAIQCRIRGTPGGRRHIHRGSGQQRDGQSRDLRGARGWSVVRERWCQP